MLIENPGRRAPYAAAFALSLTLTGPAWAQAPDPGWLAKASAEVAAAEYRFAADEAGAACAPNRAHDLRARVAGDGISIESRTRGADPREGGWRLTLGGLAWGRGEHFGPAERGAVTSEGNRAAIVRMGIVETWINDTRGLEQTFDVHAPPPGSRAGGLLRIAVELGGDLLPFLAEDRASIEFRSPGGEPVARLGHLLTTDALGRVVPSSFELAEGRLEIHVDDADAVYPLHVDPLLTSPSWVVESNQAGSSLGISVATAGDVNNDGFSDVVVGAWGYDAGQTDEGAAFLYLGSASGPSTTASVTFQADQASAQFGAAVSTAGDLNGDGFDDVIVGAPAYDPGVADVGQVFVYLGGNPMNAVVDKTDSRGSSGSNYGGYVAPAGDVDRDGYSDVAVGAAYLDDGQVDEGAVFVRYGHPTSVFDASQEWAIQSNQANARLGAVGTAGDVNGDGYDDLIVGAYLYNSGESGEGKAWVFHGGPGGLAAGHSWSAEPNQLEAQFGVSVATAGDVDGDGYADVVVGANAFDNGQTNEGAVYLYRGSASGLSASYTHRIESDGPGALLGTSVATAGDVNGDGFADVIAGALNFDGAGTDRGRIYVWPGSAQGLRTSSPWTFDGDQDSGKIGRSVATAGDVNGDGYSDVIAGASDYDAGQTNEGRAYLFLGSGDGLTTASLDDIVLSGATVDTDFGWSVASAGDVNGDGFSDVIVGAEGYDNGQTDEGGAFVYLGSGGGLPTSPNATLQSNQAGALFGWAVAGAGDVNGDGYDDVVVGAPEFNINTGQPVRTGRVFVFHGGPSGVDPTADFQDSHYGTSGPPDANFGESVSGAGDVNGDGFADVVVGARSAGEAFVYHGSGTGLRNDNETALAEGNEFGRSVSGGGDVNRDGFSDVIVGRPDTFGSDFAYVYCGSAAGVSASPCWTKAGTFSGMGHGVGGAGDVNGDGFSDVVVIDRASGASSGQWQVFHGSASGLSTTAARTVSFSYLDRVGSAGDVNGDGFSDVVIGAGSGNSAAVYLGSSTGIGSTAGWSVTGANAGDQFGHAAAGAGDVNGDGFSDVIVGAYGEGSGAVHVYYGGGGDGLDRRPRQIRSSTTAPIAHVGNADSSDRFRIRLFRRTPAGRDSVGYQFQVASPGQAFGSGVSGTAGPADSGVPGANGSATDTERLVTGLLPQTVYRWRARYFSHNPYFPASRWFAVQGNNVTEADFRTPCATLWYRDADGDTYGTSSLSQNACAQPTGYVATAGDCNDADDSMFPGNPEVCDGKDNDCNGTADALPAPTGTPSIATITRSGISVTFSWAAVAGADRYDTVRGRLLLLKSSGGDFTSTVDNCSANDATSTSVTDPYPTPVNDHFYFLVRAVNCATNGTYDEPAGTQVGLRDAEVQGAAGGTCP
ncbi:MAG TPA: FG-GAP-like repeat-containing protein [Candidatus Polarisedimenticolaceae bacterium]